MPRKVVSDAEKLPTSSNHEDILKQVEFYFSDANLPHDKFLWQATRKNEGWVSIEMIHKFKRMRRFQPFEEVVAALRESPELLEVSEDGQQVRRRVALKEPPAQAKKDSFARTVYAKGFGPETPTTQFDLETWFSQYGPTRQVRLRRTDDGTFKESVFVEFADKADADKFVETKPSYNDSELLIMFKQAYVEMKSQQHNFADTANGKRRRPFNAFRQERPLKRRRSKGASDAPKEESKPDSNKPFTESAPETVEPSTKEPTETTENTPKPDSDKVVGAAAEDSTKTRQADEPAPAEPKAKKAKPEKSEEPETFVSENKEASKDA